MTIAAYASSLSGWFLYEDAILTERTWLPRWLVRVSHDLAGESPRTQRIVNLAWHLCNGLLLWLCARQVLSTLAAGFAVGVFLLHPVQVESVAYLASRPELIAATWVLLACLTVQRWPLVSMACAGLVITGKEVGLMACLLVPLWAWVSRQTWSDHKALYWGCMATLVMGAFVVMIARQSFGEWMPWSFYGAQVAQLGRLLWLLPEALWNPVALTIDHDWSWITKPIAASALIGAAVTLFVAVRSRIWLFATSWTLVALAPRLLVPFPDGLHERHLYTPMLALSLACGASLFKESA